MNVDSCPKSEAVVQAVRSNNWPDSLRAHIDRCKSCRETSQVASWMARMAENLESIPGELPDPELIWLKAKINRRSQLPARALLPLKAGCLFGAAGLSLLLATVPESAWSRIQAWQPVEFSITQLQELLVATSATFWWIPLAAVLLFLFVFTTSEV